MEQEKSIRSIKFYFELRKKFDLNSFFQGFSEERL